MPTPGFRPSLGAIWNGVETCFRVWAPAVATLSVIIHRGDGTSQELPLTCEGNGYFSATARGVKPGDRYRYRVPGRGEYPDPCSRYQPDGVHGASEVVDHSSFAWSDTDWRGLSLEQAIVYELHVGTFTPEGSFAAARAKLPILKELGVTLLELMPVADFPGQRNWGYDGVSWFAPARCYGRPEDLKAFINDAHQLGMAVVLDVVYNHLGPDGNYFGIYTDRLFTNRHHTPWGDAINYDGKHSEAVRQLVIENALSWIHDYHFDGLRLDATHAILDDSRIHILQELAETVRASVSNRTLVIIAEDERNEGKLIRPVNLGGYGLDGVWADDFHHALRRRLAGDHEGYYQDFTGDAAELERIIRQGWLYCGQYSRHHHGHRGSDPTGIAPQHFVFCIQNHDQIGNRAFGERLHHQIDVASYRAASLLLLSAPQTPLLFMGQEWSASTPFLYFTDHHESLGQAVTAGRQREFAQFQAFREESARAAIPDPQSQKTFRRCQLNWGEREQGLHLATWNWYQSLIRWRRQSSGLASARKGGPFTVSRIAEQGLILDYPESSERIIIAWESLELTLDGDDWMIILASEDPRFMQEPQPIQIRDGFLRFSRPGGVILRRHGRVQPGYAG
jgi:maltooligosyltrehalose trehalohydrolase